MKCHNQGWKQEYENAHNPDKQKSNHMSAYQENTLLGVLTVNLFTCKKTYLALAGNVHPAVPVIGNGQKSN